MSVVLRYAVDSDATVLADIIEQVFEEIVDVSHVAEQIQSSVHTTIVAEVDGQISGFVDGFVTTSINGELRFELDLIGVRPEAQGRGAGKELITAMTRAARDASVNRVRALVRVDNKPMERAMHKCGYTVSESDYELFVHSVSIANDVAESSESSRDNAHLVPVKTLTYTGVWLEGERSRAVIRAARTMCDEQQLDIVGAVISCDEVDTIERLKDASFERIGAFRWWTLSL